MFCRLTLTYGSNDVGFELRVLLEHGCKTLTSEFSCTLTTMAVQDGKAAIVAHSLEVVLNHKLKQIKNGLAHCLNFVA